MSGGTECPWEKTSRGTIFLELKHPFLYF
jgi:hypothetical protein